MMKLMRVAALPLMGVAALFGGNRCVDGPDIPVSVLISFMDANGGTAAITSDGTAQNNPPYVNGVGGVDAVIQACSGTNDMTLNTQKSSIRKIGFNFGNLLANTPNTPAWVFTSPSFLSQAFINIHDLYDKGACTPATQCTFTTQFSSTLSAPDNKSYNLRFLNPDATTQFGNLAFLSPELVNMPSTSWLIHVIHMPAGTNPETWVVYPVADPSAPTGSLTNVAGLLGSSGKTTVSAGQFSIPFYITITRN